MNLLGGGRWRLGWSSRSEFVGGGREGREKGKGKGRRGEEREEGSTD